MRASDGRPAVGDKTRHASRTKLTTSNQCRSGAKSVPRNVDRALIQSRRPHTEAHLTSRSTGWCIVPNSELTGMNSNAQVSEKEATSLALAFSLCTNPGSRCSFHGGGGGHMALVLGVANLAPHAH